MDDHQEQRKGNLELTKKYQLKQGDVIKMGRTLFKIKELHPKCENDKVLPAFKVKERVVSYYGSSKERISICYPIGPSRMTSSPIQRSWETSIVMTTVFVESATARKSPEKTPCLAFVNVQALFVILTTNASSPGWKIN